MKQRIPQLSLDHTLFHVSGFHILDPLTGFEHHQLVQHFRVD
jgi:hypothetical protein